MSCSNCPSKGSYDINTIDITESEYSKQSPYDWLKDIPASISDSRLVEISFKNNRKDFYINANELNLKRGDYVAVQCDHGHDVGMVTLIGKIAELQLKRKELQQKPEKIIYRMASKFDIEKLTRARLREKPVMIKARQLAQSLELDMKISDVEFQGDGNKATFYYIADKRVDYRELIKLYAKEFGIKIEMKQIGARQESALIGGMGSCGRELCCSSWRNSFDSVSTQAARVQELPHNAQKLTGQCGKLKCCLMYELDQYIEAHSDFPDILLELETEKGIAYPQKKEVLKKVIWYSLGTKDTTDLIPVPLERVKEIIQLNKKGVKPTKLTDNEPSSFGFIHSEDHESLAERTAKLNKKTKLKRKNKRKQFRPSKSQN